MELLFEHRILYSNKGHISIEDVALSLLATQKLCYRLKPIIESAFPDTEVRLVTPSLELLQRSSLSEHFIVQLLVQAQESLENVIDQTANRSGIQLLSTRKRFISNLLMLLITYGGIQACKSVFGDDANQINIYGDINSALVIVADDLNTSSDELEKLILESIVDQRAWEQESVDVFMPAKREPNAQITSETSDVSIDRLLIEKVPDRNILRNIQEKTRSEHFDRTLIDAHAMDIDRGGIGWAGHVPEVSEKRHKFIIAPGIDLDELARRRQVYAEIDVIFGTNKNGKERITLISVLRVFDENESAM